MLTHSYARHWIKCNKLWVANFPFPFSFFVLFFNSHVTHFFHATFYNVLEECKSNTNILSKQTDVVDFCVMEKNNRKWIEDWKCLHAEKDVSIISWHAVTIFSKTMEINFGFHKIIIKQFFVIYSIWETQNWQSSATIYVLGRRVHSKWNKLFSFYSNQKILPLKSIYLWSCFSISNICLCTHFIHCIFLVWIRWFHPKFSSKFNYSCFTCSITWFYINMFKYVVEIETTRRDKKGKIVCECIVHACIPSHSHLLYVSYLMAFAFVLSNSA